MYDPKKIIVKDKRALSNLHPTVALMADVFIRNANAKYQGNLQIKVISTLRDWAEQQAIYDQGRTKPGRIVSNARPGDSIHNWGCAIDLGVFKNGIYIDNSDPSDAKKVYQDIKDIAKDIGFVWGGDFKTIKDFPHFEYTGKYTSKEFITLAKSGKPIDEMIDPIGALISKLQKEGKI